METCISQHIDNLGQYLGLRKSKTLIFGSLTPNKFNFCSHWLESVRKQRTAYRRIRSVFGTASVFGIEVQIEVGQYLASVGQYLGSKFIRSVFWIENEVEIDRI